MKAKVEFLLDNIREGLFDIATINKNQSRDYDIASLIADVLDYIIDLEIELHDILNPSKVSRKK